MAYTAPTPASLKLRYPEFTGVADDVVGYWLTDALRYVDERWIEGDYQPALMARAAHSMAEQGVAGITSSAGGIPAGVTSFKSASVSLTFSEAAAKQQAEGGIASTRYGREFAAILKRNFGGPRVIGGGAIDCNAGFNGFAGPLPPYVV